MQGRRDLMGTPTGKVPRVTTRICVVSAVISDKSLDRSRPCAVGIEVPQSYRSARSSGGSTKSFSVSGQAGRLPCTQKYLVSRAAG